MPTSGLASIGGIDVRRTNDDTSRGSPVASSAAIRWSLRMTAGSSGRPSPSDSSTDEKSMMILPSESVAAARLYALSLRASMK